MYIGFEKYNTMLIAKKQAGKKRHYIYIYHLYKKNAIYGE